jgi:hypothetical protein
VNAIGRAVMPAGVEQPVMMSVALDFGARASSVCRVVILYAGATFLARLLACFFVSHNYVLSLIVFSLASTSLGVAAEPFFMSIRGRGGKRLVAAVMP